MSKKRFVTIVLVAAIILVASGIFFAWSSVADDVTEQVLMGSAALQLGYILCRPLMAYGGALLVGAVVAYLRHVRMGHVGRVVMLVLGILPVVLLAISPLVATVAPEGLQVVFVVLVLVAAQYPWWMALPGILLAFGLCPDKQD